MTDSDTASGPPSPRPAPAGDVFLHTTPLDPLARPLLIDLEREYDLRYGEMFDTPASTELNRYPVDEFIAPRGTFLLLMRNGAAISGGAFMTRDAATVEIKRVWTHPEYRGQHLARRVLTELEAEAARRGFTQVVLSTGPHQPEAVQLYLAANYEPQFDRSLDALTIGEHQFRKQLRAQ